MTQQIDAVRFERTTTNLKKVAILLALVALILLYLGWIRYSPGDETVIQEMVWALRIVSMVIIYVALKCFLIGRYLEASLTEAT